jgi:TRAP-type C4-dicarboxylate transport system permease small subunit
MMASGRQGMETPVAAVGTASTGIRRLHQGLLWLETWCSTGASACMYAVMLLVAADVGLRYVFHHPLGWAYDLISMYLMPGMFLLALADTLRKGHHVRVDLLYVRCPPRVRLALSGVAYLLIAAVVLPIVTTGTGRFWSSLISGDVIVTAIAWPTWVSAMLVVIGFGLLLLQLLHGLAAIAVAVARGDDAAQGVSIAGDLEAP